MNPIPIFYHHCWRFIAACGFALSCIAATHAQGLTVSSITVDGQSAPSIAGVQVRTPGATSRQQQTLNAGQAIAAGAEITAPRGARIELESSNGNRITLHPGSRFVVGTVSARGESHQPLAGRIDFQVRKALDFYNIQYDRITAAVKGTEYSVEIDPGKAFTLTVTEGVVEVEREVQIRFVETPGGGDADSEDTLSAQDRGIRVTEEIKAGERKTYRLNVEEYLTEFRNFGEAEAYFRTALAQAEAGQDRRRVLQAVLNLMEMYWRTGRPAAAAELEGRCIALAKTLADSAGEAACLRLAGAAFADLAEFQKAVGYFEKSLAMNQLLYGGRDRGIVASNLNDLGSAYRSLGEYRKAVEYNERALAMRERLTAGSDSAAVAMSFNQLGRDYHPLGDFRRAIQYHEKALVMAERVYAGRDHPVVAMTLNHLGLAYVSLEQYRRGVEYHEKALAMRERVFAKRDHPQTADSYGNLGFGYFLMGQYRKAIEFQEKALAMRQRLFAGRDHHRVAASLHNLGRAHDALGEYRKAIEYLEQGLAMRERVYTGDHFDISGSLLALGRAYRLTGDRRKAVEVSEKALAMRERIHAGSDHPSVVQALGSLASAYEAAGNAEAAARSRGRARAMRGRLGTSP